MKISVIRLSKTAVLPRYQTEGSAAMDLVANISEPVVLESLGRSLVPTGIAMALPKGYEAQIRPRSGLSLKHGIALANGVATIDSDYRGEIGVILINLSRESFTVEPGMRIAQMIVAQHETVEWHEVHELDSTSRLDGGFGSTGS